MIKTVKIILFFLFISTTLIYFTRKSTVFEVEKIAKDLSCIRKISDFSSNKNHPVEQVENIGGNLYKILRVNSSSRPIKIAVEEVPVKANDNRKMEYVTSYKIHFNYPNKIRLAIISIIIFWREFIE